MNESFTGSAYYLTAVGCFALLSSPVLKIETPGLHDWDLAL